MATVVESASHRTVVAPGAASTTLTVAPRTDTAVSWAAVFAGAAVAAAMSLILLLLGTGFGLSSVSPWAFEGVSAETFGWSTIAWISFTSLVASALGGYIAGRLRTRWDGIHGDETFFRDTAHGFLAWSVATLFTAALLTSAIGAILGVGAKAGAAAAGGVAQTAAIAGAAGVGAAVNDDERTTSYFVDRLFRPSATSNGVPAPAALTAPAAETDPTDPLASTATSPPANIAPSNPTASSMPRDEVTRIVVASLDDEAMSTDDTQYLGRLVAQRTGLTPQEAEARITETRAQLKASLDQAETAARTVADEARKAAARASLWLFITLLMGAFASSLFATYGGRQRDL